MIKISFAILFLCGIMGRGDGLAEAREDDDECTRGRLFLSDADTTTVHAFELDDLSSLSSPFYSFTASGKEGVNLLTSSTDNELATLFQGTEADGFADSVVEFYGAGVSVEEHGDHLHITKTNPFLIPNTRFSCVRPIHFVSHDNKIAVFCDGSFGEPYANSTIWVLDETLFGSKQGNAVIFNTTLEGSHHGVAVPVDDDILMYSLPLEGRVNRLPEASSLPSTFRIVDYSGNELHTLTNESNSDTSCLGFHGSAARNGSFALACDETHGGILVVNYKESSRTFTSRALLYPDEFPEHRTGSFIEHPQSEYIVGNFDGPNDSFNLMTFKIDDSQLTAANVLPLSEKACSYAVEKGNGEVVLALLESGIVQAFAFKDGSWTELAKKQVVPDMPNCSGAFLRPGYASAFVVYQPTMMVYALDLEHIYEGILEIMPSKVSFTPFDGVVAGVPLGLACVTDSGHTSSSTATTHHLMSVVVVTMMLGLQLSAVIMM